MAVYLSRLAYVFQNNCFCGDAVFCLFSMANFHKMEENNSSCNCKKPLVLILSVCTDLEFKCIYGCCDIYQ